jgi:uncharacterized protein (DUF433 family)
MYNALSRENKGTVLQKTDIIKIRELKRSGMSVQEIAEKFHIESWVIRAILDFHD